MTLTHMERESALWKKIEAHLNERIEVCRRKNDGDLNEIETAKLRGALSAFKQMLALGADLPPMGAND